MVTESSYICAIKVQWISHASKKIEVVLLCSILEKGFLLLFMVMLIALFNHLKKKKHTLFFYLNT